MDPFEPRLCECGCGETVTGYSKNQKWKKKIKRFINGHNTNLRHAETHPCWKGGRVHDSAGYIMIYKPEHPNHDAHGYMLEHRLVMEFYLDRYLTVDEIVHHKNGIRDDNRLENLQIMNRSEHSMLHYRQSLPWVTDV
jgi:hypothetical protein